MTIEPEFPVLDAPRPDEDRTILEDEFEPILVHLDEIDSGCRLPLRVTHNPICGVTLEIGPYDLNGHDVEKLRLAIVMFDRWRTTPIRPAAQGDTDGGLK